MSQWQSPDPDFRMRIENSLLRQPFMQTLATGEDESLCAIATVTMMELRNSPDQLQRGVTRAVLAKINCIQDKVSISLK